MKYYAELFILILCVIEIFHDRAVIADSKGDKLNQKKWHFFSGLYFIVVVFYTALMLNNLIISIIFILQSLAIRLTVFNNGLNISRNGWKNFFYLSDKDIDLIIKKTIGPKILFIFCILGLIISNLINFFY